MRFKFSRFVVDRLLNMRASAVRNLILLLVNCFITKKSVVYLARYLAFKLMMMILLIITDTNASLE